jgi:protein TonB
MRTRGIPLEQAVAVGASVAAHMIAALALVISKTAPAPAPERAVVVSLIDAWALMAPEPAPASAARTLPSPRRRSPASTPPSAQMAKAQTRGPEPRGDVTPAAVAVWASPSSSSPQTATAQPIAAPAPVSTPVDDPLVDYRRRVWAHLAAHAPSAPSGSGVARVRFSLDEAGRVLFVRLVRSSGHPEFDRACLASIRGAQPLPRPPNGITRDDLVFEVPIKAAEHSGRD